MAALAAAVGMLALLNLHLLQSPIETSPVAPPTGKSDAPRQDSAEPSTALDRKTAQQFQEIVSRPLFNPSRRPVQRSESNTAETKVEPSKLRLIGVMRLGQGPPRALLRFADEPTGRWIAEGAELHGWTLRKVNERSVIVEAGKRSQELTLSTARRAPDGTKPRATP